eukprot:4780748-Pyramimonas_sp.AAC.1
MPTTMFSVASCFFHQYHLVVQDLLKTLDGFTWANADFGRPYLSALSIICNCWRTVGHPKKIHDRAKRDFGIGAAEMYAKKIPARALRGRWGYGDAVETLIDAGSNVLPAVFSNLFKPAAAAAKGKARAAPAPPGGDLADDDRERKKQSTQIS